MPYATRKNPQELAYAKRQVLRDLQLGAALLPSLQIFTNWNSAAATPSVESAERLDAIRSLIVLGEDCQAHRLREWI